MGKEKKKLFTWYRSDGEANFSSKREEEDLSESEENILIKSKSLDIDIVKRPKKSFISNLKASKSQRIQRVSKPPEPVKSSSMEWLEGILLRKRSQAEKYKHNTKLLESIFDCDTARMSRMLAMGASPNATCRLNHISACHLAAMYNDKALALLLDAGAERLRLDKVGRSPLHLAAWEGNAKQIAMLLEYNTKRSTFPFLQHLGADVQEKAASCDTLPTAVDENKRVSVHKYRLLNISCEVNHKSSCPNAWGDGMEHDCRHTKNALPLFEMGWTALHAASARGHHHCVQLLLAAGAAVQAQDLISRTPIDVVGFACYMGQEVNKTNFMETINILLNAGCKLQTKPPDRSTNTPLHTAILLGSEEAVDTLLKNGASVKARNKQGQTAMHLCVKKQNKELLGLLLNYVDCKDNEQSATPAIDTLDSEGYSVLHSAIKEEWIQGVCMALGAGASVTSVNHIGKAPIHAAAAVGNIDIFQEILKIANFNSDVDFPNAMGETALFVAVRHNKIEIVKLLLNTGAEITLLTPKKLNVFHIAAKYGVIEILEYLLDFNENATEMINERDSDTYTPLAYAVSHNHPECVKLLISKGAQVDIRLLHHHNDYTDIKEETTLLHIAAENDNYDIAKIIIKHDIETIHLLDSEDRSPLHKACAHGNREIITLLLENGADLSGQNAGKAKFSPIALLMNNVSKPTEFMTEIFDSCISSQGMNLQERNCEVTVDYSILMPGKSNMKQMSVINALVNTGNRYEQLSLLLHPLVQSFLYRKWRELLPFLYTILVIQGFFVFSLNVYVLSMYYYKDRKKEVGPYFQAIIWQYISLFATCSFAVQEMIITKINNKRYFLALETWFKASAIVLAIILHVAAWWDLKYDTEWLRLIATLALLSSWFSMMFLLSRFPDWGFYVLMFGKVANKVFKILLSFIFLILGFSFCLMIQFRAHAPFEGPWAAFVKTVVMMTSEYDYQTIITKEKAKEMSASIIILRVMFLIFLIVVSIVLMNIIVGVAINNVNHLEIIGNMKRLEKQIELITSLEEIVNNKRISKILPKTIYKIQLINHNLNKSIILRPREATCNYCKRLPANIREAIFEKAHLRKKQIDDELGSKKFNTKLNEIYKAIVGKREHETEKSNDTSKLEKQIADIQSDLELMKQFMSKLQTSYNFL